jgi:hypothetical protein
LANQNTLADLSTTPASNLNVLGQSQQGTAPASTIDNIFQRYGAMLAAFYDSLGGSATAGGTATALTVTVTEKWADHSNGNILAVKAPNAATGASTITITTPDGALSSKKIRRQGDTAIQANDWLANATLLLRYDSAYDSAAGAWVLLNPAASVTAATAAELNAGTAGKYVTADVALSASAFYALTDASTVAVDHANGANQKVTLGGNRAFGAPSNGKVGWPLNIWAVQDATGSRVPTWDSAYDFGDYGTPTLSTGAAQADLVTFICLTTSKYAFLGIRKRVD